jgi:hypothetical protein
MPNSWIEALKAWNTGKETWCLPKKGTPAYDEVRALMSGKKLKASDVKKEEPKQPPMKIPMEPQRKPFSDSMAPKVKFVEPEPPKAPVKKKKGPKIALAPYDVIRMNMERVLKVIEGSNWEDIGPPKEQAKIWKKAMDYLLDPRGFRLAIKSNADGTGYGAIDQEVIQNALKTQEDYYRDDGGYGGRDWERATPFQVVLYALMKTLDDDGYSYVIEHPEYYYITKYGVKGADDGIKQLDNTECVLYRYINDMPTAFYNALTKVVEVSLDFTPKARAKKLEEWLADPDNEYEDYYGTLLFGEKIKTTLIFETKKKDT